MGHHHHYPKSTTHQDHRHQEPPKATHAEIARLAYFIWEECGKRNGYDRTDWKIAERCLDGATLADYGLTIEN